MKNLSVFVDESGDFGMNKKSSPYYIITMVFHDQSFNMQDQIARLENELTNLGYKDHVVHTEPLIMRRGEYGYRKWRKTRMLACGMKATSYNIS
ncbi:MAG: DUF3800 domain-containing protein [Solobacterium sp.]|nr:DUF3800 domain-containing protein [Solobacterium sp.]